jgi:BON domain-containing protein
MKFAKLICLPVPLLLATGCVYSHRATPVVYTPAPTSTVITVPPVSERPAVRVYPEPSTVISEPATTTPSVSSGDLAVANTIRQLFVADPTLASAARNVRISVINGYVTMTGTVLTEHERSTLHSAIASIPGVTRVDDRVQVDLNR